MIRVNRSSVCVCDSVNLVTSVRNPKLNCFTTANLFLFNFCPQYRRRIQDKKNGRQSGLIPIYRTFARGKQGHGSRSEFMFSWRKNCLSKDRPASSSSGWVIGTVGGGGLITTDSGHVEPRWKLRSTVQFVKKHSRRNHCSFLHFVTFCSITQGDYDVPRKNQTTEDTKRYHECF